MAKPLEFATLLGTNALFSGLGPEALAAIARLCQMRKLPAGQTLFVKGDPGDALYGVRRGQIRIETGTPSGERMTIEMFGAGDVFGEIAVLDGRPRTADAVAQEDCELFVLPRAEFLKTLEQDGRLAIRIIELLCGRLRSTNERTEEMMFLPLSVRLARRLAALVADFGAELQITQDELAGLVGVTRESVNRQLQEWRASGIVELGRGRIRVDVQRLADTDHKA
ncbi:transcriptional regulator, Crp/Fnr family [Rhodovulum sp. PH10]|uniref:Crp/Fnr family transcriptional regulator n=1 Tax=Rhodovulum sp. PH10 TaxID=1187851 RepID=UPI00027C22B5|nr:Crp/Fnr family transcriptional regulator [Rhodovulum sp. PH10]EJW09312.1 transcriptional regulator, Crp/Fnr family [Rhodovulum sp. PH10]